MVGRVLRHSPIRGSHVDIDGEALQPLWSADWLY